MNPNATNAAPSWVSISEFDTPGSDLMASCAPLPVMYVGIAIRAIPNRTIRLARFKSLLFVMRANTNRPPPMMLPMVGKWFSKRWMCVKSMSDSQPLYSPTTIPPQ